MKIAQVTPLYEAVPPKLYGGTERVVAHLTDALVDLVLANLRRHASPGVAGMWPDQPRRRRQDARRG